MNSQILFTGSRRDAAHAYCMVFICMTISISSLFISGPLFAQQVERTDPPNWFCGMSDTTLNLLVKGKNLSSTFPVVKEKGIFIRNIVLASNPDYLLLQINVSPQPYLATTQW